MVKYDTLKKGLETLYRPYQAALIEYIWKRNENDRVGTTSGDAYRWLNTQPDKKSRASVIFFLNDQVDDGILEYEEKTGKGGYHRVYYPKMNRKEFEKHIIMTVRKSFNENFPETMLSLFG